MKPNSALRSFLLACGSTLFVANLAHAQLTWDANDVGDGQTDGAGGWLDALHWWDGSTNVDWTSGSNAIFGNSGTAGAVTLASPTTAGSITFNNFTGTYSLGTAGQMLTINDGITKNAGSGAATFVGPITLGGAQTWTNNSNSALSTGRNTNLIDNNGFDLTVDGTGTFNFGTINNVEVALTGSGALIKNGTGRLNIGGVNSGFTGTVTVNGGVLQATNNGAPLGAGNLTLNGGVFSFYWGTTYTRTLGTGNNQVQILGGESGFAGSGTNGPAINLGSSVMWGANGEGSGATGFFNPSKFVLGDEGTGNVAVTTFSSAIDLNGTTRTILVPKGLSSAGNRTTISGAISNSTGTAGLTKEGGGYLLLSNNSSAWNGTTTVSEGFLDMGGLNLANIGGGSGRNISVAAGAIIRFTNLSNTVLNRIVETSAEFGIFTGGNGNNFDFSSSTGANLPNAFLGSWAGNGAKAELTGTITPASDNYRLGYTGASGALGIRSVLTGTQGLIVGGQSVVLAADNTYSGNTVVRDGARLFIGRNLAMQNSALDTTTGSVSLHDTIGGGGIPGVEKTDQPTLGGIYGNRDFGPGLLSTSNQNNTTRLPLNQILGLTLNVGTGKTFSWSGGLIESSTGTYLTKTGEGTQILDDTNTYTGATTISGGTLALGSSGTIDNTSAVVLGGGTFDVSAKVGGYAVNNLSGSGEAIGSLTVSTDLSIGTSPGTINFQDLTMGALSTYTYEVVGGGTDADLANVSGSLTLTAGTALNLVQLGTFTVGDKFTLFGYTSGNLTGTFAGLGNEAEFIAAGGNWKILYEDPSVGLNGGTGTSFVTVTAIPEPRAALLGGLGLLALLRRRR